MCLLLKYKLEIIPQKMMVTKKTISPKEYALDTFDILHTMFLLTGKHKNLYSTETMVTSSHRYSHK